MEPRGLFQAYLYTVYPTVRLTLTEFFPSSKERVSAHMVRIMPRVEMITVIVPTLRQMRATMIRGMLSGLNCTRMTTIPPVNRTRKRKSVESRF